MQILETVAHGQRPIASPSTSASGEPSGSIEETGVELSHRRLVDRCFRQTYRWGAPMNWSGPDWRKELMQVSWLAALKAERDFDPTKGFSFEAFAYNRTRSDSRTWRRREWRHCARVVPERDNPECQRDGTGEPVFSANPPLTTIDEPEIFGALREEVANLNPTEREVIQAIFWEGLGGE